MMATVRQQLIDMMVQQMFDADTGMHGFYRILEGICARNPDIKAWAYTTVYNDDKTWKQREVLWARLRNEVNRRLDDMEYTAHHTHIFTHWCEPKRTPIDAWFQAHQRGLSVD